MGIWMDDKARGLGNCPRNAGKGSILRKDLGGKCIGLYFLWWIKEKNSPESPHEHHLSDLPLQLWPTDCPHLTVCSKMGRFVSIFSGSLAQQEEFNACLLLSRQEKKGRGDNAPSKI